MKSILLAIRPEWLAKILNGEKTIEIRKLFPKDYVGWVYLYCSKNCDNNNVIFVKNICIPCCATKKPYLFFYKEIEDKWEYNNCYQKLNGKVVARFWCDKVEGISFWYSPARADNCVDYDVWCWETETLDEDDLLYRSCLSQEDLTDYLRRKDSDTGFAIHISKLEIFDRPRELSEFHTVNKYGIPQYEFGKETCDYKKITKAPQNYCYIEEE